jgi:hypothetical protein
MVTVPSATSVRVLICAPNEGCRECFPELDLASAALGGRGRSVAECKMVPKRHQRHELSDFILVRKVPASVKVRQGLRVVIAGFRQVVIERCVCSPPQLGASRTVLRITLAVKSIRDFKKGPAKRSWKPPGKEVFHLIKEFANPLRNLHVRLPGCGGM